MILIPCPYCGPRAQTEFSYGGDASVVRPQRHAEPQAGAGPETAPEMAQDPDAASTRQWLDYIYLRENLRGPHLEWWQHHSGCRAWIKVRRDTATHEVLGAWRATETIAETIAPAPHGDTRPDEGER
jgi:heterotetrameric sarcosine oxidase delta subunit